MRSPSYYNLHVGVCLQLISTVLPTYLVLRVAYGIQHVYQNPPDAAA